MAFIENILNYLNPNKNISIGILYLFLFLVVLGSIAYYVYHNDYLKIVSKLGEQDIPNTTSNSKKGEIVILYFFANWCPHCQAAKLPIDEVSNKYNDQTVNGYRIKFKPVDCSDVDNKDYNSQDETELLRKQYNVEGYPTIKMIKAGDTIDFDSKITKTTLIEFVQNMTKD